MTTKPPTEPGHYHWRAKEGDAWGIFLVILSGGHLIAKTPPGYCMFAEDMHGQWQRIPTPDEMQEAWAVCDAESLEPVSISDKSKQDAIDKAWDALGDPRETSQCPGGYTCKPVSIVPRESEVEG